MKGYASLRLYGDVLNFAQITKVVGIKPDGLIRKGKKLPLDRVAGGDSWLYASRQYRRNGAPARPLDYLMKKIWRVHNPQTLRDALVPLGVTNVHISMLLEVVGSHVIFCIPKRHLELAAKLKANLFIDVWRTKYRETPLINNVRYDDKKEAHLYYATDFANCGFNIKIDEITHFLASDIQPVIHVW